MRVSLSYKANQQRTCMAASKPALWHFTQAKGPTHAVWEARMARYSRTAVEVLKQPDFDMGYVRVCVAPLAAAVHKEALAWVAAVSSAMQKGDWQQLQVRLLLTISRNDWPPCIGSTLTCAAAQAILATIARLEKGLRRAPESLDELKDLLGMVAAVRSGGMARELQYTELEERFRRVRANSQHCGNGARACTCWSWLALSMTREALLAACRTRVLYAKAAGLDAGDLEAEHAASGMLQGRWHELEELAELTDAGLHTTKVAFAKATREQVRILLLSTTAALLAAVRVRCQVRCPRSGRDLPGRHSRLLRAPRVRRAWHPRTRPASGPGRPAPLPRAGR